MKIAATAMICLLAGSSMAQNVTSGVYTEQQATRGLALYKARCTTCHGDGLVGRSGPPLVGADFMATWSTQPVLELANKIRRTMPKSEPVDTPKLTAQETYVALKGNVSLTTTLKAVLGPLFLTVIR